MTNIETNYVWSFDLVASMRTQKSMTIDDVASQIALERMVYWIETFKIFLHFTIDGGDDRLVIE